tara:strand:- start:216 stop:911 length:696 start_codon:yes stop_codon:yes gene_type:complete
MIKHFIPMAILTLIGILLMAKVVDAEVIYNQETKVLHVSGETNVTLFYDTYRTLNTKEVDLVYMDGLGGDAYNMYRMMWAIKKHNVPVVIPQGKVCASACAFAAMSGSKLTIDGTMWIHRGTRFVYDFEDTLDGIYYYGQMVALSMVKPMREAGYKFNLIDSVVKYTDHDNWYVVTNDSQLDNCRYDKELEDALDKYFEGCYIKAGVYSTKDAIKIHQRKAIESIETNLGR